MFHESCFFPLFFAQCLFPCLFPCLTRVLAFVNSWERIMTELEGTLYGHLMMDWGSPCRVMVSFETTHTMVFNEILSESSLGSR